LNNSNKPEDQSTSKDISSNEIKKKETAKWGMMNTPEITEEMEKDLKFLNMRRYVNKSHFYKNTGKKGVSKLFQVYLFLLFYELLDWYDN
jgi:hypothetical protein